MAAPSPGSPLASTAPSPGSPLASTAGSPSLGQDAPGWTRHQEKLFETALANHDQGTPDFWDKIASIVPGKDAASVKRHYDLLVEDVNSIEAGLVPLPPYSSATFTASEVMGEPIVALGESPYVKKNGTYSASQPTAVAAASNGNSSVKGASSKSSDQERRKGIPWTEEEHKSFLLGLAKFGKGDWRSISRNFVRTRTPTQVASHAQKYFIRLNSINKDRRRSSIHDITSVNGDTAQSCQGPITGQGLAGHTFPNSATCLTGGAVYGAPVGQPIAGTLGPTVGTPVLLSSPGVAGTFVARGPLPRPVVPGAPLGVVPVAYPLAQPVPQPAPQQAVHR